MSSSGRGWHEWALLIRHLHEKGTKSEYNKVETLWISSSIHTNSSFQLTDSSIQPTLKQPKINRNLAMALMHATESSAPEPWHWVCFDARQFKTGRLTQTHHLFISYSNCWVIFAHCLGKLDHGLGVCVEKTPGNDAIVAWEPCEKSEVVSASGSCRQSPRTRVIKISREIWFYISNMSWPTCLSEPVKGQKQVATQAERAFRSRIHESGQYSKPQERPLISCHSTNRKRVNAPMLHDFLRSQFKSIALFDTILPRLRPAA